MIRKCTDEDISDEELEKVINPFYDNYHEYIITYVMPEVIAFYIASSFSRNAMWEATFYQHYNSAKDIFNIWKNAKKVKISKEEPQNVYYVHHGAKIRYIDPLFNGERISKCCKIANKMIENNLSYDMNNYVYLDFNF